RRRHTRFSRDWSSDVCSSDLADACKIATRRNQSGAAPVRMRWKREQRLLEQILPIAGEFLFGGDTRRQRLLASAGGADNDAVARSEERRVGNGRRSPGERQAT